MPAVASSKDREQELLARVQLLNHELDVYQEESRSQTELLTASRRELELSLGRYADLYDFAPVGYATLDASGCILDINLTGAALLGTERALLLKMPLVSRVASRDKRTLLDHLRETRRGDRLVSCELSVIAGGLPVPVQLSSRAVRADGVPLMLRTVIFDLRDRREFEAQIERANAELAARSRTLEKQTRVLRRLRQQLIDAQEAERRRIASLLHDDVQQALFAIRLKLAMLGPGRDIRDIERLLDKTIASCRALSAELRPPTVHGGLLAALNWLVQQMRLAHGLSVTLRFQSRVDPPESEQSVIFQATRELLFNVVKHADTDRAVLEVSGDDEQLVVQVSDKGRGFDSSLGPGGPAHMGLVNIVENVEALGGSLEISSAPGQGTSARIALPLARPRPAPRRSSRQPPALAPAPRERAAPPRDSTESAGKPAKPRAASRRRPRAGR